MFVTVSRIQGVIKSRDDVKCLRALVYHYLGLPESVPVFAYRFP